MFANALTQTFSALFAPQVLPADAGAAVGRNAQGAPAGAAPHDELRSPYESPAHDLDQRVRASGEW
ncbi:hypothetical protein M5C99_11430 [Acidovorax sp. NCPPB 2350]|nr:hypothetical protein M5C99_11430 [Acidovorax sp. NCPPB 2350]